MEVILGIFLGIAAVVLGIFLPCLLIWYILVKLGIIPPPPYHFEE